MQTLPQKEPFPFVLSRLLRNVLKRLKNCQLSAYVDFRDAKSGMNMTSAKNEKERFAVPYFDDALGIMPIRPSYIELIVGD